MRINDYGAYAEIWSDEADEDIFVRFDHEELRVAILLSYSKSKSVRPYIDVYLHGLERMWARVLSIDSASGEVTGQIFTHHNGHIVNTSVPNLDEFIKEVIKSSGECFTIAEEGDR